MDHSIIDAHIHLDKYHKDERQIILQDLDKSSVEALVAVSEDLASEKANLKLSKKDKRIKLAFGFHPEQKLPNENEIGNLQEFIRRNQDEMVAVGEVGLPYFLRKKHNIPLAPYKEMLSLFIQQAAALDKPVVLHAVYGDASIVCDMLEKHTFNQAHFHWFKGDPKTTERMMQNGYFISITPDVLYEAEIQHLVKDYPLSQMMVETDGPWPFAGPFSNKMTHPEMIHQTIRNIAAIKQIGIADVYHALFENTKRFYSI